MSFKSPSKKKEPRLGIKIYKTKFRPAILGGRDNDPHFSGVFVVLLVVFVLLSCILVFLSSFLHEINKRKRM